MPWHATLSIIEPKSVITRESHPKLVSRSSFISPPFFLPLHLPCTTGTEGAAAAAVSRELSREEPFPLPSDCSSIGDLPRGDLLPGSRVSGIASDWFSPWEGGEKVAIGGGGRGK